MLSHIAISGYTNQDCFKGFNCTFRAVCLGEMGTANGKNKIDENRICWNEFWNIFHPTDCGSGVGKYWLGSCILYVR